MYVWLTINIKEMGHDILESSRAFVLVEKMFAISS